MKLFWKIAVRIAVIINVVTIVYEWVTKSVYPWWLYSAACVAFLVLLELRERDH